MDLIAALEALAASVANVVDMVKQQEATVVESHQDNTVAAVDVTAPAPETVPPALAPVTVDPTPAGPDIPADPGTPASDGAAADPAAQGTDTAPGLSEAIALLEQAISILTQL